MTTFLAYPDGRFTIGGPLEAAAAASQASHKIQTWKETEIAGRFIATEVLSDIEAANCLAADISYLNFNVTYEIGYAIGKGKSVVLLRHAGVEMSKTDISAVGIFDTLGYVPYENQGDVAGILGGTEGVRPLLAAASDLNWKAPVYLLEARFKTDVATRIVSRVKKAKLYYRSFDPNEQPRLAASEAIRHVAQSYGVLVHLLPADISDARVHNLRAAFIAGLAAGMGKVHAILQEGDDPIPIDYRDLVVHVRSREQIDEAVAEFATRVTEAWQTGIDPPVEEPKSYLQRLNLGASAAENELRDLSAYYLDTDASQKAYRGEARLIVGRRGSGKTAIFARVRDQVKRDRNKLVLDLRPEGYRLLRFKEDVLSSFQEGTFEHTIAAVWEYVLLLEICHGLLERDHETHVYDRAAFEAYHRLAEIYRPEEVKAEADFSDRLDRLLGQVTERYQAIHSPSKLSEAQVTNLVQTHDLPHLRAELSKYLGRKGEVWILFDNIDRGWPTRGLEREDLIIVRGLVEALRKIERYFQRDAVNCYTLVFLRNDVYELLVDTSPDRGKESRVVLDWTDPDLLRELIRRRLVFNGASDDASFEAVWRTICVSHVNGEESSQYLIDRSLMRPRCLIDIVNYCRSAAVNLRHTRIDVPPR